MVKKTQLPVIGGVRKVINQTPAAAPGTTIAEFGSGTVTLAQLKNALGLAAAPAGGGLIGSVSTGSIAVGPGLAGGGPLLGVVPIRLIAPIPIMLDEDEVQPIIPGPPGMRGLQGPPGPAVFISDESEELLVILVKL